MKQKCGSYVCVQLLQTLNILFENIRNETSLCEYPIRLRRKTIDFHVCSLSHENCVCFVISPENLVTGS